MWLRGLNTEQVQAVQHNYGPLLILAGAGSGKTTVLVARTGRLIEEKIARPSEICVLTFTNKAARELKERVTKKITSEGLWTGTFHSFGLRILKKYHSQIKLPPFFSVLDQGDSQAVIKELLKDLTVAGKDKFDLARLGELIHIFRSQGKFSNTVENEYHELAEILAPRYERKLQLLGATDFEGLLLKPLELFRDYPQIHEQVSSQFSQVMVDEFQDTNPLQMKLIQSLLKNHQNIAVVGDDDQSIYGWRGAEVKNILDFPKKFKDTCVISLERNYRSQSSILELANSVIKNNKKRYGKTLKTEGDAGSQERPEIFVHEGEDDECRFIINEINSLVKSNYQLNDIAVLYRSNSQGSLLESYLRQERISYQMSGGIGLFDRKETKDILAYLRLMFAPNDLALRRVINTPHRGVGDATLEKLQSHQSNSFLNMAYQFASQHHGLSDFFEKLKLAKSKMLKHTNPSQELIQFLLSIGYKEMLFQQSSKLDSADRRWAVIEIFVKTLDRFVDSQGLTERGVRNFIDSMELKNEEEDTSQDPLVSLMTLHASKGLEFPVVFIIGLEEDILPHRSLGANVDEERRLFYVGITRAKQKLILSRCRQRTRYGTVRPVALSRFLLEFSSDLVNEYAEGARPVSGKARDDLVANFLSQLSASKRHT